MLENYMDFLDAMKSGMLINLLQADQPISASKLASHLSVTPRMVRYNLPALEGWLKNRGAQLVRRRKIGLYVEASSELRQALLEQVNRFNISPGSLSSSEREQLILLALLSTPSPVYIQNLANKLLVSAVTITKNLNAAAEKLQAHGLNLIRRPNYGLRISGPEKMRRRMITDLLLETLPTEWLLQIGREQSSVEIIGLQEPPDQAKKAEVFLHLEPLLAMLDLPGSYQMAGLVEQELKISFPELAKVVLMLSLSIQRTRIAQKNTLWQEEALVPPIDDPTLLPAIEKLTIKIEEETGSELPEAEKNEMALHILGAETQPARQFIIRRTTEGASWLEQLADAMMVEVGRQLDPQLAEDAELREALLAYLQPAIYRIRYNLPLYNPQACEIRNMYPAVFESARQVCRLMEPLTLTSIPEEECGYVAMCLIAAVEGSIQRRQPRVAVICPLGIATSKMLVSRLRSEFPHLNIVGVYSYEKMETLQQENADLIISTSPQLTKLSCCDVIQVNPLLYPADRVRILNWIQLFSKIKHTERG
jgi:mannitol operon transcriptional antiterminator